jgi:hypothetical protein
MMHQGVRLEPILQAISDFLDDNAKQSTKDQALQLLLAVQASACAGRLQAAEASILRHDAVMVGGDQVSGDRVATIVVRGHDHGCSGR